MISISKLDWDSEYWGIDFFNVEKNKGILEYKLELNKLHCKNDYICQALTLDSDIDYINFLEKIGFKFIESKVSLIKSVRNKNICEGDSFAKVTLDELEKNKHEFRDLYSKVSRFIGFGKEKVDEFYYKWVKESINGNLDDNCIGYYDRSALAGFITFKIRKKKLIIGLVGVFSKYQRMSISQQLLYYIESIAFLNNCDEIHVSTQGKNIKAINAYIKSGFFISDIKHWYYLKEIKR